MANITKKGRSSKYYFIFKKYIYEKKNFFIEESIQTNKEVLITYLYFCNKALKTLGASISPLKKDDLTNLLKEAINIKIKTKNCLINISNNLKISFGSE